jgi:hypothetical protein
MDDDAVLAGVDRLPEKALASELTDTHGKSGKRKCGKCKTLACADSS